MLVADVLLRFCVQAQISHRKRERKRECMGLVQTHLRVDV